MELQNFINENENYISIFKDKKLYVRKYSQLGLCIVNGYYNNKYDYENNEWMKYCRGAVIDIKENKVVCVPPQKSMKNELITNHGVQKVIDNYNESENIYQPLIDGTMINMFYHNNEWMISTRSNIGAKNKWDGKTSFLKMFLDVNGDEWFNELNKNYCYSFILHHKNNRNISPIENNFIFLVENYEIIDGEIKMKQLDNISNIENIVDLSKEMLCGYQTETFFSIKGFTIKNSNRRLNWINPNFEYVKQLKMNHNDKFLNYISLRQKRLLKEYLKYFPEDNYLFEKYREEFNNVKNTLYQRYVSRYIKKEITNKEIEYSLKPLIYELHGYYLHTNEKINIKIVSDYLHNLDGKKIMFIKKYLE